MQRLRSSYQASPLHLLAVLATFAVAGYGFFRIFQSPSPVGTLIYFFAAVFAHDLLAFPLYSALNWIAHRSLVERGSGLRPDRAVPPINYLRAPAMLSGLFLVLFFPLILGLDSKRFTADTGQDVGVYLGRWLGLCALLFAGSALLYAIQIRRATAAATREREHA